FQEATMTSQTQQSTKQAIKRDIGHSAQEAIPGPTAYIDTALGIATIIAEANERLYRVQCDAATVAFADISKQLDALLTTTNPADALVQWTDLYQANVRRLLDVTRTCFEIVPQTQAQMAKLLVEPFASYNDEAQKYLVQFNQALTDRGDAAAAPMKDFMAKTLESVSANQA